MAGMNAAQLLAGQPLRVPPETTALGALLRYITDSQRRKFQPMNVNFGLLPPLSEPLRGKAKKEALAKRAVADMQAWAEELDRTSTETPMSFSALADNAPAR
jgi:methylenetetrahydrofolate--tRNA-(uracil-5-)-methyltransferase